MHISQPLRPAAAGRLAGWTAAAAWRTTSSAAASAHCKHRPLQHDGATPHAAAALRLLVRSASPADTLRKTKRPDRTYRGLNDGEEICDGVLRSPGAMPRAAEADDTAVAGRGARRSPPAAEGRVIKKSSKHARGEINGVLHFEMKKQRARGGLAAGGATSRNPGQLSDARSTLCGSPAATLDDQQAAG